MNKTAKLFLLSLFVCACASDDDGVLAPPNVSVSFNFTQNWEGTNVTNADLNTTMFTNENGEVLTIQRLRYLLSHFELVRNDGEIVALEGYRLIDLSDSESLTFAPANEVQTGSYTLNMVYGFNEEDNIDGNYPDLNSALWNWPAMLGGGYHFLQFDGMYNVDTMAPSPFNYHHGTARVSDGVFEQNYVSFSFPVEINITDDINIEIRMDISEYFKNPNVWDLNVLDTPLMPNYDAQKMIQENAASVFSVGAITQ